MNEKILNLQKYLNSEEAFLIIDNKDRFYFTSLKSSYGFLLVMKNNSYLFLDFRYFNMYKNTKNINILLIDNIFNDINKVLKQNDINKLYVDCNKITLRQFFEYENNINCKIDSSKFLDEKIRYLRSIKTNQELENIKKAQQINDEAFSFILGKIYVGKTELEIAFDLEYFFKKNYGLSLSFDTIVASGKNSSFCHANVTNKKIEKNDFIVLDFGCIYDGYCCDMTRTVCLGIADEFKKEVYYTVLKAQKEAINFIKSGVFAKDVDFVARNIINESGFEGKFGHSLGHGVGIDIHETPNVSPNSKDILISNNVITIEPGIYLDNEFGVRIEDMIIVNENGYENITKSNKELIEIS